MPSHLVQRPANSQLVTAHYSQKMCFRPSKISMEIYHFFLYYSLKGEFTGVRTTRCLLFHPRNKRLLKDACCFGWAPKENFTEILQLYTQNFSPRRPSPCFENIQNFVCQIWNLTRFNITAKLKYYWSALLFRSYVLIAPLLTNHITVISHSVLWWSLSGSMPREILIKIFQFHFYSKMHGRLDSIWERVFVVIVRNNPWFSCWP